MNSATKILWALDDAARIVKNLAITVAAVAVAYAAYVYTLPA